MSQRQLTLMAANLLGSVLTTLARLLGLAVVRTCPGTQKAGRIAACPQPPPPHRPPPPPLRSLQGLLPPGRRLGDTKIKQHKVSTHKVSKEVQKVYKIVKHTGWFPFLADGSLKKHIVPAESTRLVNVLKRGILCLPGRTGE
jgi:hypothetical protein